jgi:NAD(P) transhydrogenase
VVLRRRTEVELTKHAVPYECGVSRYRELARGQIAGDSYGVLKLLVSTNDRTLLGVHIFGTNATELVHIGQAVMDYKDDDLADLPSHTRGCRLSGSTITGWKSIPRRRQASPVTAHRRAPRHRRVPD